MQNSESYNIIESIVCAIHIVVDHSAVTKVHRWVDNGGMERVNDPFAGSPTKTLLRLLLPLNEQV